jgi:hypothetical protein
MPCVRRQLTELLNAASEVSVEFIPEVQGR